MTKKEIHMEEIVGLTKALFHAYYTGDAQQWFAYLCPDSIYIGTGEPMLFGRDAIQSHFKAFQGRRIDVVQEEYYPIPLGDTAAQVCGNITVKSKENSIIVVNHFTMSWRLVSGELKMIHQHNSYEYTQPEAQGEPGVLKMDMNTTRFVRDLLVERPTGKRLAIQSGKQTVYINPYTVLYVQSQRKRTELVCVDRVISCNRSMGELSKQLPEVFYPLHRSYLVNTLYITSLRRFEVELISGITLPVPAPAYTRVKQDLKLLIETKDRNSESIVRG